MVDRNFFSSYSRCKTRYHFSPKLCLFSKGKLLLIQTVLSPVGCSLSSSGLLPACAQLCFTSNLGLQPALIGLIKLQLTVPDHLSTSHQFLLFQQGRHFNAASNQTDSQCQLYSALIATTCQCCLLVGI